MPALPRVPPTPFAAPVTPVTAVTPLPLAALVPLLHNCAGQDYPASCLYMVATPIGNVADVSLRALQVLHMADIVACEDTRHTRTLLQRLGLGHARQQLQAVHQHNEATQAQTLVHALRQGARIAYVCDAGTPGISDPGARLVAAVRAAGLRVLPIPGASALTALASASAGVDERGLCFVGFAPTKTAALHTWLGALAPLTQAVVLLEAPHRIAALAQALAQHPSLSARHLTVGRELTKHFESIATMVCADFSAWLTADSLRQRGEFSLLLHALAAEAHASAPNNERSHLSPALESALSEMRDSGLRVKSAVAILCRLQTQTTKKALYARALELWGVNQL